MLSIHIILPASFFLRIRGILLASLASFSFIFTNSQDSQSKKCKYEPPPKSEEEPRPFLETVEDMPDLHAILSALQDED